MKRKTREFKQECCRRLRKAYDRMRLLKNVEGTDLNALIDTWEHLESEIHRDIEKKNAKRDARCNDNSGSHASYRARGGLDLP